MELVVGTYDEVLLGFRIVAVGEGFQLETSFTDRSHAGCVKTVAISNKGVLASGSTDEAIRLLNLKKQRELGSLVHHSGTVTSLEFHKGFMFSTSEDGKLCLWKTFTWECLRTFKGHKSAVNCVSVHPSGKLALTVGADRSLHTWNLITGRSAYITNIKQVADIVKWAPHGDKYLIVINNKIDVYSVETAEVTASFQATGRINSIDFYNDSVCVYGGEGGHIYIHDIENNKALHTLETDSVRIKGLCVCPSLDEDDNCKKWLCICSSDGHIKIYRILESGDSFTTELLVEHTTGFRLTCLAVYVKDSASHNTEAETETVTAETSERTDKTQKKKNRKRKGSSDREKTEVVQKESEIDIEAPEPKKLKKSDDAKEGQHEIKQKKMKKDKSKKLKRKEQKIGEGKTACMKKKNKKKKKKTLPV